MHERSLSLAGPLIGVFALLNLLPSAGCSSLFPIPTASDAARPIWATYSDDNYGFAFDYPSELTVETQTTGPFQVLIYTEPEAPFYFRATRDYLPNEVVYFLDTAATGQRKIGEYTWTTYYLPDGYGDAVGFSPPIYALRAEVGNVLYSALFYNQDSTTELQDQILSTFRVLE